MIKFSIQPTPGFNRDLKKFKKDMHTFSKIKIAMKLLEVDPFVRNLKTHKVNTSKFGIVNSSTATSDLRILWYFDHYDNMVIVAVKLGGHDEIYD